VFLEVTFQNVICNVWIISVDVCFQMSPHKQNSYIFRYEKYGGHNLLLVIHSSKWAHRIYIEFSVKFAA
jgi:hypothetical protein